MSARGPEALHWPAPGFVDKAGIAVGRVEIDKNGKIVIVTARPEGAANGEKPEKNEWDGVLQ